MDGVPTVAGALELVLGAAVSVDPLDHRRPVVEPDLDPHLERTEVGGRDGDVALAVDAALLVRDLRLLDALRLALGVAEHDDRRILGDPDRRLAGRRAPRDLLALVATALVAQGLDLRPVQRGHAGVDGAGIRVGICRSGRSQSERHHAGDEKRRASEQSHDFSGYAHAYSPSVN